MRENGKARRAALYMRLSRDDEGGGESASISTQREILRSFAKAQGLAVAGEYADDGYSGTNYDRPEFQRLMADIEAGRIDCVLTKDLSRLGRNSAKTTELLDEVFPRHGVRFIAVTDGFDSLALTNGMAVATPFMLAMNEVYARDISLKIRSSLRAKMERGDFVSPFAPYGYRKDPANKNRLLVDPEAARVVRSIFQMAAAGRRPSDIARTLNEGHVPTPAAYRCRNDPALHPDARRAWSSSMLCKLLRNSVYLGRTEHAKTTKLSFKSRETRANRREDWIVVEGTHEPLVSRELFEQARRRSVARRCAPCRGFVNPFAGLALCADCGRHMTTAAGRRDGGYTLCCGGYKARGAAACGNHFIACDALSALVLEELRALLCLTETERRDLLSALAEADAGPDAEAEALRRRQEKRLREVNTLIKRAFELYALGGQSEASYRALTADYERERRELEGSLRALRTPSAPERPQADFAALLDEALRPESLTPDLLSALIDRIEVEQGRYERDAQGKRIKRQTVRIFYRFSKSDKHTPPSA